MKKHLILIYVKKKNLIIFEQMKNIINVEYYVTP